MISFGGAKHHSFVLSLLLIPLSVIWGLIAAKFIKLLGEKTIIEYFQLTLGSFWGKMLGLLYCVFFIIVASSALRDFSELWLHFPLIHIPLPIIAIIMSFIVAYGLRQGLHRASISLAMIAPFLFISIIFITCVSIPINTVSLFNSVSFLDITNSSNDLLTHLPFVGMIVCWFMFVPIIENKNSISRDLAVCLLIVSISTSLVVYVVLSNFGPYLPIINNFHLYLSFAQISISTFLQRFEPIFLFAWMISGFAIVTVFSWCAIQSAKQCLQIKSLNSLIFPIVALVYSLSLFLFQSYEELRSFMYWKKFGMIAYPLEFGVPLILLLSAKLKSIKNASKSI